MASAPPAALAPPRVPPQSGDAATSYVYHCHLLWHEDQGMMGQFLVVEPGEQPDLTRPEGDSHDHDH